MSDRRPTYVRPKGVITTYGATGECVVADREVHVAARRKYESGTSRETAISPIHMYTLHMFVCANISSFHCAPLFAFSRRNSERHQSRNNPPLHDRLHSGGCDNFTSNFGDVHARAKVLKAAFRNCRGERANLRERRGDKVSVALTRGKLSMLRSESRARMRAANVTI